MLGSIPPRLAALLPQQIKLAELRVRTRARPEQKDEPGSTPEALKNVLSQLGKLRASLERLEKTGRSAKTLAGPGDPAKASSSTALALVREQTFTTLRSTAEVNTTPTSFTPVLPTFDGPQSTAQPIIGGTYDGDQGDQQLKFRVRDNRNIGDTGRIRINIRDEANKTIQNLDFDSLPANTELTLNNGLTLQFDAGYLKKNENFYVDVSTSVGTDVDPDNPFNGTRDLDPKFESGQSVTAGSFDVNGITINVAADDTINSVVGQITASAAGVTASYDGATDSVVLTQKTAGAENSIVVGNDTSGFLAATKLAGATETLAQFAVTESGEEVNTTPTSYTPILPTYDGPQSTAQPIIGGIYDGDQGDQQLKFRVRDNRNIGDTGRIRINIRDEANKTIQNLDFDSLPANTELTLNNGLTLQFDAGYLKKNENFYVDVSTSVGTAVDPDKAFNGTRDQDPLFEPGQTVTAGSFDVNGVTINVAASDTINSVVGNINSSGAGVTASFDAVREKVVLTQQTAGSFKQVVLENDTSGFLAATKLDAPSSTAGGQGHDSDRLISTVADLSEASTGNFEINGVSIAVDVGADSLSDVVARINGSGAGVTASYTESSNVVTIVSQSKTADLVLDNGTSNFFSALNITAGTFKAPPEDGAGGRILEKPDVFELELEKFGSELDAIFKSGFEGLDEELRPAIEQALTGTISDSFSKILDETGEDKLRSSFGIDFDFREAQGGIFGYNGYELANTLEEDLEQLTDFLFREDSKGKKEGLVVSLIETVRELEGMFQDALRPTSGDTNGLVVDLSV